MSATDFWIKDLNALEAEWSRFLEDNSRKHQLSENEGKLSFDYHEWKIML